MFRDEYKRLYTDVLAIDALKYRDFKSQFTERKIVRELIKSYTGFNAFNIHDDSGKIMPVIATGNWGCGAFGGDHQLKCNFFANQEVFVIFLFKNTFLSVLIQLIAASQAERDLIYCTFNDVKLEQKLKKFFQ